jgi:transposase
VERAEREGGEIAWGDESGLSSQDHGGRGYAPVGETPESDLSQKQRVWVNFIASVSNQGESHFMLYTRKFDSGVMIGFIKRLIKQAEHKIFEIIDNHPVHHSKAVQEWLAAHKEKIEVFYLPSYSPELNPAEYLNGDVKQGVYSKPPTRNLDELKPRILSHLHMLQKLPSRTLKYFENPHIAYALENMHCQLLPS